ncbi:hypothetical protein LWI29_013634 [Acer saccharum]|uniref:PA domain-containing protein n=1 Tax=Acer saccharum TaxID=4024 RepID=A0AA39RH42_ACESA|nr:hypothetical protein LWI29_013634 [Acer saccharum]
MGEDVPTAETVKNTSPSILTVAASTIDRSFPAPITLGNNETLVGQGIFTENEIGFTGLVYAEDTTLSVTSEGLLGIESQNPPLEASLVAGKVVLIFPSLYHRLPNATKFVKAAGAVGFIFAKTPRDTTFVPHQGTREQINGEGNRREQGFKLWGTLKCLSRARMMLSIYGCDGYTLGVKRGAFCLDGKAGLSAYNACFCLATAQCFFLLILFLVIGLLVVGHFNASKPIKWSSWLVLASMKQSEILNPSDHQRSTKQSWNGTKYLKLGSEVRDSTSAVEASISDKPYILEGREVGTVWRVEVGVDYSL